jgi:hypothetical protein
MADTRTNPNLFSRDPAERRAFRDALGAGIGRFVPPELRPLLGFVAGATPSAAVERAGAASMRAVQPGRTGMERLGDVGEVLSETAGVVAPAMVAGRAAMPAAEAVQEAFMGFSVPARAAAETVFERLNQPGPMPETLYSNPRFEDIIRGIGRARDNARRADSPNPDLVPRTADPDVALSDFARARERMLGASNDLSFGELQGLIDAQAAARRGVVEALSGEPSVRLFNRNDRAVVVGPGMGPGEKGRFRISYFDEDRQPINHMVYETKEEALNAALREGFDSRTAAPAPLPPPRNAREETSDEIARLLREGKVEEAEALLNFADERRLYQLYERGEVGLDLPMDFESAQARGREMGFVEEYFKGMYPYDPDTVPVRNWRGEIIEGADRTPRELTSINRPTDFPSFNRGEPGYQIAGVMGRDPNVANNFAAWPESAVYPLQVRHGRTYDMDAAGSRAGLTHFEESGRPFRDQMRSGEFDTGVIRNTSDEGDIAFVLRPENIRSRFARFDPRFAGSRNLMAGVGGAGVMVGASGDEEEPAVRGYAQGGEVMMRSNMPEQLHRGIGSLNEVARGMYRGGAVQYMQAGGEAITLNAANMVTPQVNANELSLAMREAQSPAFRTLYEDDFFVNSPLGYAAYEDGTPFSGSRSQWAEPAAPMEQMLGSVRREVGAPDRTAGSGNSANIQELVQIFDFLQQKPVSQLTEQERALLEEIPQYLAMRTGM